MRYIISFISIYIFIFALRYCSKKTVLIISNVKLSRFLMVSTIIQFFCFKFMTRLYSSWPQLELCFCQLIPLVCRQDDHHQAYHLISNQTAEHIIFCILFYSLLRFGYLYRELSETWSWICFIDIFVGQPIVYTIGQIDIGRIRCLVCHWYFLTVLVPYAIS